MRIWKRLLGTALCLCAAVCVMSVSASAEGEHTEHPICGANHENIGDHTGTCNNVIWTEVTQDNVSDGRLTLAGGGSYYLGTNIAISNGITINGTVNLCLNGHSITKTSESDTFHGVIKVESGSSFTLCDCNGSGMGNGKITHADGVTGRGVLVGSSSVKTTFFLMYGGTISGNRINGQDGAGVRVHNASFKMYGGTISENHVEGTPSDGGGGVNARGKFIMYGGEISRNTSNGDCGGVAVVGDSFEMHGGNISGNTATGDGGGVGLWNDSFRLSGGTISGNTATRNGGGVYFSGNDSDTLTISGTVEISGNSAANGGGVYINSQDLAVTGGSIINNNAADGSGGGVYFNVDGSSFNVSGNVSITGNKKGATPTGSGLIGADNNVYLPDGKTITVAGALTGSNKIGVTTENKPSASDYVRIASGNTNYAKPEKFLYENDGTIAVSAVVTGRITKLVACQHNWSGEWATDAAQHWKECSICNGKKDDSAHTYDRKVAEASYKASDANCVSPALYHWSCVCGAAGAGTFESGEKDPDKHRGALGGWQSDENNHWKEYTCCQVHADEGIHQWGEGRETKSPTCTAAGEKTYTCSVCSGTKKETLDALGHNYSEPSYAWNGTSCTAERVCSHDSSHKETETVTAAVTVTQNQSCLSDELSTYTASFQNAAFAAQTQENVVTANKLGHDFENGTWQSDEDEHWKKCSRCDVTDEATKAPHSGGTATCVAKAKCAACGVEYGAFAEHIWGTWTSNGDGTHTRKCETAGCTQAESENCSGGTATCIAKAECVTCGTAYGDLDGANHSGALGGWQSDENKHWKEYPCCHVHADEDGHHWNDGAVTTAATCTAAGEKTYICTDCGRTKTEQIDALGHDWGEWDVTKQATTSAEGEKKRTCNRNASHTETRPIPKLTPAPSSGGSSTPAITVPVSGSGDTVHVSASVSGSTAEVKEIKSAELDKIGTDSAVVIDLSGLNKGVTGVTLSTDTIDSICKTEADGVTIKLPNAELRVDRQTLAAVTEQAAGSKIRLVVEPDSTARNTMTAAQRSTLAGMKNAAALEAYFVSNDTRIHDFKGGSVELSIPYRADGAIRAWFLKEDGTREPVSARYDKENAQLILHHFSHYVIEELDSSAAYTVCAKDDSCPLGAFGDLTATAWYHDGVHYCLENGLMRGVSGGKFLPDGSTTRAQLVTILWRLEGNPAPVSAAGFSDVADGVWYAEAVRWAAGCGVVKGYDNGCFGPNDAVTREQMAAILYRYAQHKGYDVSAGKDTNILSFNDAFAVSEYAIPAMQWACGSGMVRGIAQKGGMFLVPGDTTTRAQAATLIMRFQSAFAKEP